MATYRLVGSFNGWNPADDTYLLTHVKDNCYKIVWENVAANTEFKITKDGGWDFAVGASRLDKSTGTASSEGTDNIKILNDYDKITVYFFEAANTWDCWIVPSIFEYQDAEENMFILNNEDEAFSFEELFNNPDSDTVEQYKVTNYDSAKNEYQFTKHWDAGTSVRMVKYGYGRIITSYPAYEVGSEPTSAVKASGNNVLINESSDYLLYFQPLSVDYQDKGKYWFQQQLSVINVTLNLSNVEANDLNGEEIIAGEWSAEENYEIKLTPVGEGRAINNVQIMVGSQDLTHGENIYYDSTTQTIYLRAPYIGDVTITASAAIPDTCTITLNGETYHPSNTMDGEYTFNLVASETNSLYLTQVQNEVDSRVTLDSLDVQPAALKDTVTVADNAASFTNEDLKSNDFSVSYSSNTGKVTINFAANTVAVNQELHYCKSSIANGTTVLAGSEVTATYTANSGYILTSITVNGVAQNIDNEHSATITITNYQGEKIIATAVSEINGQEIILHPVSNGEVDNSVDLYPRTTMNNVIVNSAGKKLKDYIDEKCQGGGTPSTGSTGTIDFNDVVNGNLAAVGEDLVFCTSGYEGSGANAVVVEWNNTGGANLSFKTLVVEYKDTEGNEYTATALFCDEEKALIEANGSVVATSTNAEHEILWTLNATNGGGGVASVGTQQKYNEFGTKVRYLKLGATDSSTKLAHATLTSNDFAGYTITKVTIDCFGSAKINGTVKVLAGETLLTPESMAIVKEGTAETPLVLSEFTGEAVIASGSTTYYSNVFVKKVDGVIETLDPVVGALYYNLKDKELYQWRNEVLDVISPTLTIGNGADQAYKGSYGQTNYTNIGKLQAMIGSTTEEVEGDEPQTITTIELKGTKIKVGSTVISEEQLIALLALLSE